jgi:uncharacterized DUF497 family protein
MFMEIEFRWNEWNLEHVRKHGCTPEEAQMVIRNAGRGFPRKWGDSKWCVEGRGQGGRVIRVIYVYSPENVIYVIHAMPLTTRRRRG